MATGEAWCGIGKGERVRIAFLDGVSIVSNNSTTIKCSFTGRRKRRRLSNKLLFSDLINFRRGNKEKPATQRR